MVYQWCEMKKTMCKKFVIWMAAPLFWGATCYADQLVTYSFPDGTADPSFVETGVKASPVTDLKEGGLNYISISKAGQVFWDTLLLKKTFEGASGSIAAKQYVEFTVEPLSGKTLNLETLGFDYGGNGGKGHPFFAGVRVFSSLDDYAEPVGGEEFEVNFAGDLKSWIPSGRANIDLSKRREFGAVKGPVTFRIYARSEGSDVTESAKAVVRVSNIVLEGKVQN